MVTARLSREDAVERGWLLDGYPRSFAQAQSLEKLKIMPDIYIVLDVCEPYVYAFYFYFLFIICMLVIIHYSFPSFPLKL